MAHESQPHRRIDPRFQEWPAAYQRTDPHGRIHDSIGAFEDFYSNEAFEDTDFVKSAISRGIDEPVTEFRCLLDYVYVWLVEGGATLACPTYEHYLLCIIGIADIARYGDLPWPCRSQLRIATNADDGYDLFYWGKRPTREDFPATWDAKFGSTTAGELTLPHWTGRTPHRGEYIAGLPLGWEGFNHPALDRAVYEHARERALSERAQTR